MNSQPFQRFYDIGNAKCNAFGFHIKDKGYLEGKVNVAGAAENDSRHHDGYGNLETGSPFGDIVADARRNLAYARKLGWSPATQTDELVVSGTSADNTCADDQQASIGRRC